MRYKCSFKIKFEQKHLVNPYTKINKKHHFEKRLIKMDASLAFFSLLIIKKFDHFLQRYFIIAPDCGRSLFD